VRACVRVYETERGNKKAFRNEQVSCKLEPGELLVSPPPNTEFNYAKQTIFVMGMAQARIGLIPYPVPPSTAPARYTYNN